MKRIYVAEDSPAQQDFLRAVLELGDGFESRFFSDGLELYRAVMEGTPDLLLLDIIMPSLNGVAICRLLKYSETFAALPILVTSSIIDANLKERVAKAGADRFLAKPFQPDQLLAVLDELLAGAVR